jgi:putative glutamine amidotransferase
MPLIGITTSLAPGGPRAPERAVLNSAYLEAVQQAGGTPVVLPPRLTSQHLGSLLAGVDGVLLTGGGDVDPERYGQEPHPQTVGVAPVRDDLEEAVLRQVTEQRKAVLAVCRGMQVLNVVMGGSLHQHIPDAFGDAITHAQEADRTEPIHDVRIEAGTRLASVLGGTHFRVNSMHHQAVDALGEGVVAVSWAPDGVVEGIEVPAYPGWLLGVQWHPEEMVERWSHAQRLFAAFVEAAA